MSQILLHTVLLLFALSEPMHFHNNYILAATYAQLPTNTNTNVPKGSRTPSEHQNQETEQHTTESKTFKNNICMIFHQCENASYSSSTPTELPSANDKPYNISKQPNPNKKPNSGKIYFPEQQQEQQQQQPHLPCVDKPGQTFCTEVTNYPDLSIVENVLNEEYASFFGRDLEMLRNVSERGGFTEYEETPICESITKTIYPKSAQKSDSSWGYIVNSDKFIQGVRVEECYFSSAKQGCSVASFPNRYKARCKQDYIYRALVGISDNKTVSKDDFLFPSSCKCYYRVE